MVGKRWAPKLAGNTPEGIEEMGTLTSHIRARLTLAQLKKLEQLEAKIERELEKLKAWQVKQR